LGDYRISSDWLGINSTIHNSLKRQVTMVYSIIAKSKLKGAQRLDAEYYQPEYLENEKLLAKIGFRLIGEIGTVVYGTTPVGASFVEKGIPFIRSQNFSNLIVDDSDIVYASEEFHNRNKKSAAKPRDILFAAVGATIGELAVIQKSINEANINQNIAKVRINKEFNPYFVALFFASRIGQLQISRLVTGNAQAYLNSLQIREFKIPKVPFNKQEEIASYFIDIEEAIGQSKSLYSQAENLLLQELGLKDFKPEEDLSYVVNLSDGKSAHRLDAEYFQPKYEKIISKIKNQNAKLLGDFVKDYSTGFPFKSENYQEEGIPLIRINNIKRGYLDLSDTAYLSEKDYLSSPKDTAKPGDIVLSMSGTIGMTAMIPSDIPKSSINQRILRFTSKNIEKEYLVLLLNSIVGSYQLERIGTGGVQTNISYKDIKNVLIPELHTSTQQKIADLVRKSYEARKKTKELLEEAKRKVELVISEELKK